MGSHLPGNPVSPPHQTHSSGPAGAQACVVVTTTTPPPRSQVLLLKHKSVPAPPNQAQALRLLLPQERSTLPSLAPWTPRCGCLCCSLLFPPLAIHANTCPFPGHPHVFYCFSRSISRSEMVLSIQPPFIPSPDPIPNQQ